MIFENVNNLITNIIIHSRQQAATLEMQTFKNFLILDDETFLKAYMKQEERALLGLLDQINPQNPIDQKILDNLTQFLTDNKQAMGRDLCEKVEGLILLLKQEIQQMNDDDDTSTEDSGIPPLVLDDGPGNLQNSLQKQDRVVKDHYLPKIHSCLTLSDLITVIKPMSFLFSYRDNSSPPRVYSVSSQIDKLNAIMQSIQSNEIEVTEKDLDEKTASITSAYFIRGRFKELLIQQGLVKHAETSPYDDPLYKTLAGPRR